MNKRHYNAPRQFRQRSSVVFGANTAPHYFHGKSTRLLQVQNDYFTAGVTWLRKDGVWSCIEAAPIIAWMRRTSFDQTKKELLKRGCSWKWLLNPDPQDKPDLLSAGQARSPKPPSFDVRDAVSNIGGARIPHGITNTYSSESWSETAPTVASPSLQTGAQPTAALEVQVAYRDRVVSTAGG